MKCDKNSLLLYAVTDRSWTGELTLYEQVEAAIKGGVTFIQLREKELDNESFVDEALKIKSICSEYNIPFVINDNVHVAMEINADGVHVGQNDMTAKEVRKLIGKDKILGVSVQNVEQAILAQKQGADYLGVGAVFHTDSKSDADHVSYETLKQICNSVKIPVVAIGGIGVHNVSELKGSDISGIAVISAIFGADDIQLAAKELRRVYYENGFINSR